MAQESVRDTTLQGAPGGRFLAAEVTPEQAFFPEAFSAEDRLIAQTAKQFLRNEVLPHVERIEQGDHALMDSLMRKAGELGLLACDVPEVYGGLGLQQTTSALVSENLNPQQSFALTHEAHTVIATLPLLYFGNDDQKRRYLPKLASGEWIGSFALSESNSGSDALAMQTCATLNPDGSHYLLNGEKMWITNSAFAQLFTVFAKVDGDRVTAFLVERDTPGLSFGKEERKLGMHGTSTRRVILENVAVPIANALEVGKGHYAAFCALNLGRFKLEAGAVGGLKATLAQCVAYAGQRKTFGRPLTEYGLILHKLAEMAARTFALESMVYRLAGDLDRAFAGIRADAPDASTLYHRAAEEMAIECCIVKVIGSEAYSAMTDEAIQIHGGYGYTEEFPVARAWRDQRLLRIGEGANEIVRLALVNTLLKRDKQGRLPVLQQGREFALELSRDGDRVPRSGNREIDRMGATAQAAKGVALAMLYEANERLGQNWMEIQEVAAAIADLFCHAYALDSVWLRCLKMEGTGDSHLEAALAAARVVLHNSREDLVTSAKYVLAALHEEAEDGAFPARLHDFMQAMAFSETSSLHLRRELAEHVIAAEGYPV